MRNVIMIATDQQKVYAMSCVDSSYQTPQLDRLAERGVRLTGIKAKVEIARIQLRQAVDD